MNRFLAASLFVLKVVVFVTTYVLTTVYLFVYNIALPLFLVFVVPPVLFIYIFLSPYSDIPAQRLFMDVSVWWWLIFICGLYIARKLFPPKPELSNLFEKAISNAKSRGLL